MLVINFFGAPSAGKSTAASGLYYEMKKQWIETEYVQEYAKELVLSGSSHMLSQQNYIFAKQEHRLNRLASKVAVAISDSPLLLSSFYAPTDYPHSFHGLVFDFFHRYDNINIFVKRSHEYSEIGRVQKAAESDYISEEMQKFLRDNGVPFYVMTAHDASPRRILSWLVNENKIQIPVSSPFVHDVSPFEAFVPTLPEKIWHSGRYITPSNLAGITTVG